MKRTLFILLQVVVTLALLEGLLQFGLSNVKLVEKVYPAGVPFLRELYAFYDRRMIQFEPDMARWDKNLFYTLKPGEFYFKNREFSNHYFVNSKGIRDTEEKLKGFEIAVLGDSFAMGWGVDQDQTFAAVLEKKLGRKVVNTAVASYGTAREFLMLKQLDTSKLKTIVIQYSDNDIEENDDFLAKGFNLITQSESAYNEARAGYLKGHKYKPFRYAFKLINRIVEATKNGIHRLIASSAHADSNKEYVDRAHRLAKVIRYFQDHGFAKTQIIFFTFDNYPELTLPYLEKENLKNFKILYLDKYLDRKKDFFILDDHANAEGHRVAAEAIAPLVKR